MIHQTRVLLASAISLVFTAGIAQGETGKPVQLAQAEKPKVAKPVTDSQKQTIKSGVSANKNLTSKQVSPTAKVPSGAQGKPVMSSKGGVRAGEHPDGEQGGKPGGGPGQLKAAKGGVRAGEHPDGEQGGRGGGGQGQLKAAKGGVRAGEHPDGEQGGRGGGGPGQLKSTNQLKSTMPSKSGLRAGEHPDGEQGGRGGGPQGGGQLKSDSSSAAAARAAAAAKGVK